MNEKICHICLSDDIHVDEETLLICDTCDEYYCYDCSYIFTQHYQHEGMRCYHCSNQSRLKPLDKRDSRLNYILKYKE
jgi:hypothetical protein